MPQMPDRDRIIIFLQSIAIQAVEAQDAYRNGDIEAVWEYLDDIGGDLRTASTLLSKEED